MLLLLGGRVLDPSTGRDETADVVVEAGRIVRVGPGAAGEFAGREQVERMSDAVSRHFPEGTRITRPQGGLVLWLELPGQVDTNALFERAAEENIAFVPGDLFSPSGLYRNCLRLNCGNPWTPAIEAGVRRLGELAAELPEA